MNLPDYPLGETLDFMFTTRAFATGAPIILDGSPGVEVYEDDDIVQILLGETLVANFDGVVGLNHLRIVATGANGYEVGKSYHAVLSAGTVGGVAVTGEVVASFSIERSPALRPTVVDRKLDVSAGGEAGIDWANIGTKGATVDLSDTSIKQVDTAASVTTVQSLAAGSITAAVIGSGAIDADAIATDAITNTKIAPSAIGVSEMSAALVSAIADKVWDTDATARQTLGTFGQAIGDPIANAKTLYQALVEDAAGASVTADVAAIKAETALIVADTNELQVDDVPGLIAALNDISIAQVNTEVDTALADINLDHLVGTATAIPAIVSGTYIDQIMDDGTATFDRTTDSLQALRDNQAGAAPTAAVIADAVWDEDAGGHQTLGTFGQAIGDPVANAKTLYAAIVTDAAGASVAADIIAVKAETVLIVADTNELQVDDIPTLIAAVQSDTDDIQTRLPAALVGSKMDSNTGAINASTSAAAQLALSAVGIVNGAAEAGTLSITEMTTDLTEATDDHYIGRTIIWTSGVLLGQASDITDYLGSTGKLTYTAVTDAPAAADTFVLL